MGAAYAKHQSRKLFIELQALESERDAMNVEWGQLQLEQSTHTTHGKVEEAARKRLGMKIPGPQQVMILRP
ncbi:MAG TPA: cell division protein FtsL [Gammaproteobacteria bacterium]|nr:cell division protein FtsL [Gammaproteobacteria bacterium]